MTMPRTSLRLLYALTAAALLWTGIGDAYGVHHCPHHDALPGASIADHGSDSHHARDHHDGAPTDRSGHGPCTCVGACRVAVAVGMPRLTLPRLATGVPFREELSTTAFPALARPFALPLANAPPPLA